MGVHKTLIVAFAGDETNQFRSFQLAETQF